MQMLDDLKRFPQKNMSEKTPLRSRASENVFGLPAQAVNDKGR